MYMCIYIYIHMVHMVQLCCTRSRSTSGTAITCTKSRSTSGTAVTVPKVDRLLGQY